MTRTQDQIDADDQILIDRALRNAAQRKAAQDWTRQAMYDLSLGRGPLATN